MPNNLRSTAEARIKGGTAPLTRGCPPGLPALNLLHDLASEPETAGAALKLLHELQVHQVKLDLQYEQTEQNQRQLAEDVSEYTDLFELAPFAYLALEPEGLVIAANRRACDWLATGSGHDKELAGRRIETLLAPECGAAVRELFAALDRGAALQSCPVQSRATGGSAQAVVTAKPGSRQVLMAFLPAVAGVVPAGH